MDKIKTFVFSGGIFGVSWLQGWMVIVGVALIVWLVLSVIGGPPPPA